MFYGMFVQLKDDDYNMNNINFKIAKVFHKSKNLALCSLLKLSGLCYAELQEWYLLGLHICSLPSPLVCCICLT